MKDWYVEGIEYSSCNCAFGCPCQFEAAPTYGNCRGIEVTEIENGQFDGLDLSGLRVAMLYAWPGLIADGDGEMQAIIDERADDRQRTALETILHGGETEEGATHWWVFRAMSSTIHPTLFKPIEFEVDMKSVTARLSIPGVVESNGEPIRPGHSTDSVHRARIVIPDGIEFQSAEMGSSTTKTGSEAAMTLDYSERYGQWNVLRHSGSGIVHGQP